MTSLGQCLQYSCCKFPKCTKLEANLVQAMDFASVELFSVTPLALYIIFIAFWD